MPAIHPNGRITRHPPQRGDGENAEMKMYLSKLKDLVPFMPKNRKLSKLEIIQHVIDYICDLQSELETHPEMNNFDAATSIAFNNAAASNTNISASTQQQQQSPLQYQGYDDEANNGHSTNGGRSPAARPHNHFRSDSMERLTTANHVEGGVSTELPQSSSAAHSSLVSAEQRQRSSPSSCNVSGTRQPLVDRHAPNTMVPVHSSTAAAANLANLAMAAALPQQNLSDLVVARPIFASAAETATASVAATTTTTMSTMSTMTTMTTMSSSSGAASSQLIGAPSNINGNNSLPKLVSYPSN